jgi:hypothetical protein
VTGEALVDRNPDFMIYSRYIGHWEDGTPLTGRAKESVLGEVVAEVARRGWVFGIESEGEETA